MFRIGLQNFHYNNAEDVFDISLADIEKNAKPRIVTTSCRQVIEEYLSANQHLDRREGDRLILDLD